MDPESKGKGPYESETERDEIDRGETMGRRRKGALTGQSDGGKTLTLP